MLIKNGLHAHLFPDYPFGLIASVIARAPAWALAGSLAGLALMLVWAAKRPHAPTASPYKQSEPERSGEKPTLSS
jgi:presenilin-like A22 family membrane protease